MNNVLWLVWTELHESPCGITCRTLDLGQARGRAEDNFQVMLRALWVCGDAVWGDKCSCDLYGLHEQNFSAVPWSLSRGIHWRHTYIFWEPGGTCRPSASGARNSQRASTVWEVVEVRILAGWRTVLGSCNINPRDTSGSSYIKTVVKWERP